MAVLVGDTLRGWLGAATALLAICLPGGSLMFAIGMAYQAGGNNPTVLAALKGVAAAAIGLDPCDHDQAGQKITRSRL